MRKFLPLSAAAAFSKRNVQTQVTLQDGDTIAIGIVLCGLAGIGFGIGGSFTGFSHPRPRTASRRCVLLRITPLPQETYVAERLRTG